MRRVLIVGNSGSGKSTLAGTLTRELRLAHLDLDTLAWLPTNPPARRDAAESAQEIRRFTAQHDAWVIEGCYADLARLLLVEATELVFLNPGVEACERHCRERQWEPHKYATAEAQDANLAMLLDWVRTYSTRDDACSLIAHRALYEAFAGPKREVREVSMDATPDQIAGARAYEALFVASLIGPFAPIVAEAAGIRSGDRVLDVACGTGVLTREAARRSGARGRVTGLDAHSGMLAVAREMAAAASVSAATVPGAPIEWQQGLAESLPFADASFDVVTSQFGLMFFSDRPGAIAEMRRVVRPGGRLAVAVWASIDAIPAFAAELALFERLAGSSAAADALRVPFSLGDTTALAQLFAATAGPSGPAEPAANAGPAGTAASRLLIATHASVAHFASVRALVEADLRGWLPRMGVHLAEPVIAEILAAADAALAPSVTREPDGAVTFPASAHVVRWTRPA